MYAADPDPPKTIPDVPDVIADPPKSLPGLVLKVPPLAHAAAVIVLIDDVNSSVVASPAGAGEVDGVTPPAVIIELAVVPAPVPVLRALPIVDLVVQLDPSQDSVAFVLPGAASPPAITPEVCGELLELLSEYLAVLISVVSDHEVPSYVSTFATAAVT